MKWDKSSQRLLFIAGICSLLFLVGALIPGPETVRFLGVPNKGGPNPTWIGFSSWFGDLAPNMQSTLVASTIGLAAAFLGVVGVLITVAVNHYGAQRRFETQLAFDNKEKKAQRDLDVRKEVFLDAADAISSGVQAIYMQSNFDIDAVEVMKGFLEKRGAIAKTYVVGSDESVAALVKFSDMLNLAFFNVRGERSLIDAKRRDLNKAIEVRQHHLDEQSKLTSIMRDFNFGGEQNPSKWNSVRKAYEWESVRVVELGASAEVLAVEIDIATLELFKNVHHWADKLTLLVTPIADAARRDLGLSFDATAFEAGMCLLLTNQREIVEKLVEKAELGIEARKNGVASWREVAKAEREKYNATWAASVVS